MRNAGRTHPAVSEGIIGIGVEDALECTHALLKVHFEQPRLDGSRGVVKGQ